MRDKIRTGLAQLDTDNDDHWTTDGLPRLDVMKGLVGETLARADITSAAEGFSRSKPFVEADEAVEAVEAEADEAVEAEADEAVEAEADEAEADEVEADEVEADEVEASDKEIEKELEVSRHLYHRAHERFVAAQKAMDQVIIKRGGVSRTGRQQSIDIMAYQKSQAKQREISSGARRAMAASLNANKTKF